MPLVSGWIASPHRLQGTGYAFTAALLIMAASLHGTAVHAMSLREREMEQREADALKACPGAAEFAQRRREQRASGAAAGTTIQASRPALRDALVELAGKDQALRLAEQSAQGKPSPWFRKASADLTRKAVQLMNGRFPTVEEVGRDGVDAAWLLVQHAGMDAPEFQRQMLAQVESTPQAFAFQNGEPALLADKVLVTQGRPQRYGTQFELRQGRYVPLPIQPPDGVDIRRASVGLMPLPDYDCFINAFLKR